MHFASSLYVSDPIDLVMYTAFLPHTVQSSGVCLQLRSFSLLPVQRRVSLQLSRSLLLFKNNPAWKKPTFKHEKNNRVITWKLVH